MKKTISLLLILCLTLALLAGCSGKTAAPADEQAGTTEAQTSQEASAQEEPAQTEPAAKKTMVIGDTTFNSENWEETVDPTAPTTAGPAFATVLAKRWFTIQTAWNSNRGWQSHGKMTAV